MFFGKRWKQIHSLHTTPNTWKSSDPPRRSSLHTSHGWHSLEREQITFHLSFYQQLPIKYFNVSVNNFLLTLFLQHWRDRTCWEYLQLFEEKKPVYINMYQLTVKKNPNELYKITYKKKRTHSTWSQTREWQLSSSQSPVSVFWCKDQCPSRPQRSWRWRPSPHSMTPCYSCCQGDSSKGQRSELTDWLLQHNLQQMDVINRIANSE